MNQLDTAGHQCCKRVVHTCVTAHFSDIPDTYRCTKTTPADSNTSISIHNVTLHLSQLQTPSSHTCWMTTAFMCINVPVNYHLAWPESSIPHTLLRIAPGTSTLLTLNNTHCLRAAQHICQCGLQELYGLQAVCHNVKGQPQPCAPHTHGRTFVIN